MTYALSDIHGCYDKYAAMLDLINFGEQDTLYVLGDMIDRGNDGIKILLDMSSRPNVFGIMGNHEAMALETLLSMQKINDTAMEKLALWILNGGEPTVNEFMELDESRELSVLKILRAMPLYKEIEICGRKYILLHGGLENFSPDRPLNDYSQHEIVWGEIDFEAVYFPDKYLIFGHIPTPTINGKAEIFRKGNLFDIDCGAVFDGGRLGCLCLDNMREFYV